MKILGLDLAQYKSGWCIYDIDTMEFEEWGVIEVDKKDSANKQLNALYWDMNNINEKLDWFRSVSVLDNTITVVKESLPQQQGTHTHIKTLQALAKVHAILELMYDIPKEQNIAAISVKWKLCNKGNATKEEVQSVLNKLYSLNITDTDISDSMGVVHTYLIKHNESVDAGLKKLKKELKELKKKSYKTKKAQQNLQDKIEIQIASIENYEKEIEFMKFNIRM